MRWKDDTKLSIKTRRYCEEHYERKTTCYTVLQFLDSQMIIDSKLPQPIVKLFRSGCTPRGLRLHNGKGSKVGGYTGGNRKNVLRHVL